MKTILFFTSELKKPVKSAECNDLYKIIDNHLALNSAKSFFGLFKYDQPTGTQILEKIAENPSYIHYCGHGGLEGEIQLIDAKGSVYSLNIEKLELYLKENINLECLFFGSCNSDKLVERLRECAEYSIGFSQSPEPDVVNKFYDHFYAQLARHGSPFKAFRVARDKFIADRTYAAGSQVILRSKNNVIMELIQLEGLSLSEKAKLATTDLSLGERLKKLALLKGKAESISEQLLITHPFAEDVVLFSTFKRKLAHEIASQVIISRDQNQVDSFERRLSMVFDIIQDVIIAFEERKSATTHLIEVGKRMPKDATKAALKLLKLHPEIQICTLGFQELLAESVEYCYKVIKKA